MLVVFQMLLIGNRLIGRCDATCVGSFPGFATVIITDVRIEFTANTSDIFNFKAEVCFSRRG